jgi:hypothetical protein
MKFSTRQDVQAPIEDVFGRATNFDRFERVLKRQGHDVRRVPTPENEQAVMCWQAVVDYRGKTRNIRANLAEISPPNRFCMTSKINGVESVLEVDFVAITPSKSRMIVGLELSPKTLAARLFVQSLKLGKSNLDRKFADRVERYAALLVAE